MIKQVFKNIKTKFESFGAECGRVRNREDGSVRLSIKNIADLMFNDNKIYMKYDNEWSALVQINQKHLSFTTTGNEPSPVTCEIVRIVNASGYATLGDKFKQSDDFKTELPSDFGDYSNWHLSDVGYSEFVDLAWMFGEVKSENMGEDTIRVGDYDLWANCGEVVITKSGFSSNDQIVVDMDEGQIGRQVYEIKAWFETANDDVILAMSSC
jgi:hypothetical protein